MKHQDQIVDTYTLLVFPDRIHEAAILAPSRAPGTRGRTAFPMLSSTNRRKLARAVGQAIEMELSRPVAKRRGRREILPLLKAKLSPTEKRAIDAACAALRAKAPNAHQLVRIIRK